MTPWLMEFLMADTFSSKKRSQIMAAVRSRGNKATEERLAAMFRRHRIAGWRRHLSLPGRPDFAFRQQRLVIFIDGCFWHGCPEHLRLPQNNREYWTKKIARNKARDELVSKELTEKGWCVLRVWEHELRNEGKIVEQVQRHLKQNNASRSTEKAQ